MLIKYEVRTAKRSIFFEDKDNALAKAYTFEKVGISVEVYMQEYKLYANKPILIHKSI